MFYEFNTFRELLDKETHINMPTNNWKESLYSWLNGNLSQYNWFDKTHCTVWDYVKETCTINPANNSKEFVDYWLCGNSTKLNWFDEAYFISWDLIKNTPVDSNLIEKLVAACEASNN